jgi:hypothetical protein
MQLLNHGSMATILLLAGMLAFVLGFALLAVYKRTIARHMQRAIASRNANDQDHCSRRMQVAAAMARATPSRADPFGPECLPSFVARPEPHAIAT